MRNSLVNLVNVALDGKEVGFDASALSPKLCSNLYRKYKTGSRSSWSLSSQQESASCTNVALLYNYFTRAYLNLNSKSETYLASDEFVYSKDGQGLRLTSPIAGTQATHW